jgi:hypothetical protein
MLAGVVSRSTPAVLVALVAQGAGGVVLLAIALASAEPVTVRTVLAGGIGGVVGGVGLVCLYQAFAGPAVGLAAPWRRRAFCSRWPWDSHAVRHSAAPR